MKLRDYIKKYKLSVTKFAADCEVPYSTMYTYINEKAHPRQDAAERIERISDGCVTVMEVRGRDDRYRYK
jgi:hypothetical protein